MESDNLLGVNREKVFMPSIASRDGLDLSKYKIVRNQYFACNLMHVGRDEVFPVALYGEKDPALVSPAYVTFKVTDPEFLNPDYLMMLLHRAEFDRFTWFICDSSIRGGLEWSRFCEIRIPVPTLEKQKTLATIYSNMRKAEQQYKKSIEMLDSVCDLFLSDAITKFPICNLGEMIAQSPGKNDDLGLSDIRGVSTNKELIETKANMTGVSLVDYKILSYREFVYTPTTSRSGDRIPLAFNEGDKVLVSKIYTVFKVTREDLILPEFLFLWFKRPEFDRYARFHSWGSARETFDWADMKSVSLPVPPIEVQKSIIALSQSIKVRMRTRNRLKELMQPLVPILSAGASDEI